MTLMLDRAILPSLPAIQAFEAAARLGGFAAAARELGTTAASVSYHVARLERQVGLALFRRHARRVELTGPGQLVARDAAQAFELLRASFVRAVAQDAGRLRVTALPTFGAAWLAPRLGGFRAMHPEIRVDLDLAAEPRDLAAGGAEVAIRNGHGRWPGLYAVRLFPALFMPLCAPPLVARAAAALGKPAAKIGVPLLGRPDWWRLWFAALGANATPEDDAFGMTFADEHLDAAAAVAGHGVTIGSPILHAAELAAGRLVPAHPLVAGDGRAFWWVYPVARRGSAKVAAFGEWLLAEASNAASMAQALIDAAVIVDAEAFVRSPCVPTAPV